MAWTKTALAESMLGTENGGKDASWPPRLSSSGREQGVCLGAQVVPRERGREQQGEGAKGPPRVSRCSGTTGFHMQGFHSPLAELR